MSKNLLSKIKNSFTIHKKLVYTCPVFSEFIKNQMAPKATSNPTDAGINHAEGDIESWATINVTPTRNKITPVNASPPINER